MNKTQSIIDRLLSSTGLYDKIYGKNTDLFLFDQDREDIKNTLKTAFGYHDIDYNFPKIVDDRRVTKMTKIFFTFAGEEEKVNLFTKN